MIELCDHGGEDWRRLRAQFVTSSDATTLMGDNPYKTVAQLFHEKIHGISTPSNLHTERGIRMEPLIFEKFLAPLGAVRLGKVYISEEQPWLTASPDAFVRLTPGVFLYEIKCPADMSKFNSSRYYWQVYHQMMVMGSQRRGRILACDESLHDPRYYDIELIPEAEEAYKQISFDFFLSLARRELHPRFW